MKNSKFTLRYRPLRPANLPQPRFSLSGGSSAFDSRYPYVLADLLYAVRLGIF